MSCLCLDELSLSEQSEVINACALSFERRLHALSVSWPSPVSPAPPPIAVEEANSPRATAPGDGHVLLSRIEQIELAVPVEVRSSLPPACVHVAGTANPLSKLEDASMLEQQVKDHPALQVCYPGHRPYMYRATGNRETKFYVECSACMVRSQRADTPDLAATAWARRFVEPIVGTADHAHALAVA